MKKYLLDFTVSQSVRLNEHYVLLKLKLSVALPQMQAGQFVEVRIDDTPGVMLRRPISINYVDYADNTIWLLVQLVGKGTKHLALLKEGDTVNMLFPLGNGFSISVNDHEANVSPQLLLVGGGAGIAPMLYLGKELSERGFKPTFLLGARNAKDLLEMEMFEKYGMICTTTEDGSMGEKGFVTQHSILKEVNFSKIYACGPKPMMMAVAKYAKANNIDCEVSLENKMACGLGACLCCVEDTNKGNVCVCKEGPVFNIKQLSWQI